METIGYLSRLKLNIIRVPLEHRVRVEMTLPPGLRDAGRCGTEGDLQIAVTDALLLEIPDPRNLTKELSAKLISAFKQTQERRVTHLVEEPFMKCHTALEVREAAKLPLGMPLELQRQDRRNLDDTVFELLGVRNPRWRKDLIDRLYREVASHFRSIRIVEVQKMEQRRHGGKDDVSQTELALDAWNHLDGELHEPLPRWAED